MVNVLRAIQGMVQLLNLDSSSALLLRLLFLKQAFVVLLHRTLAQPEAKQKQAIVISLFQKWFCLTEWWRN